MSLLERASVGDREAASRFKNENTTYCTVWL